MSYDAIDRDLAIRTVLAEAGNQGPEGMAAVAAVIKNRSQLGRYGGKSPAEVVTARNQFEPWNNAGKGAANDPMSYAPGSPKYENAAKIVDGVFSGAIKDPTGGATHFYSPGGQAKLAQQDGRALVPSWAKGKQGLKIGDHMFFSPDGPNGGDLSQGLGNLGQDPTAALPTPAPGAGASPFSVGASGAAGGMDLSTNPLLALLRGGGRQQAPQHGALNTLLFGQNGWQGHLGKAMPNGILGALFGLGGGNGGGAPAPQQSSALGQPMQLPGATLAQQPQPDGAALPPVANPDAPMPPPRPTDLTPPAALAGGGGGPLGSPEVMGSALGGGAPWGAGGGGPMQLGALGAGGGMPGGNMAGGGVMDVLKSMFGIG